MMKLCIFMLLLILIILFGMSKMNILLKIQIKMLKNLIKLNINTLLMIL